MIVGKVCDDAAIGGLSVQLTLRDGTTCAGSPRARNADDARQLDHTGYRDAIDFGDGQTVSLSDVVEVSVRRLSSTLSR